MTSRQTWTPEQRAEALELYPEHGPAHAGRQLGIPLGTVASWARRAGVRTVAAEKTRAATEHAAATMQQKKLTLADQVADEARRVLGQLFAPTVEKKIVTLSGGLHDRGDWAIAEVERDAPTFADQQRIATTFGILVDKLQVLTGGATAILGTAGDVDQEVRDLAAEVISMAETRTVTQHREVTVLHPRGAAPFPP